MNCNNGANLLISVIVTTYNWPSALALCLQSLYAQRDQYFEIIIADDGSRPESVAQVQEVMRSSPVAIQHIWHPDEGFRAAMMRNKAVAASQGRYLLFVDGDCVLLPDFIAKHRALAEVGYFVPGNRVLLSEAYTQQVLNESIVLHHSRTQDFLRLFFQGKVNRVSALLNLPLGRIRKLRPKKWQQAMTCNLAVWRDDFMRVNGFDELFAGWGYEDSDLVIRLIHAGVMRKEGRFAVPVLHLWHVHHDRTQQAINLQRLMERVQRADYVYAEQGVIQYLL